MHLSRSGMEKAREFLEKLTNGEAAEEVSRLSFTPHLPHVDPCFYEYFVIRGVRLVTVHPQFISFSFKVPHRLTDGNGNLAMGAITTLVDFLGSVAAYQGTPSLNVSADMSISRISTAKLHDELEIISRCLGRRGGYCGTHVLIQNKTTGEVVAEGRHSVFDRAASKL